MPQGHKCKGRRPNGTILGGFALTKWGLFPAGSTPAQKRRKKTAAKPKTTKRAVTMTPAKKKSAPARSRSRNAKGQYKPKVRRKGSRQMSLKFG